MQTARCDFAGKNLINPPFHIQTMTDASAAWHPDQHNRIHVLNVVNWGTLAALTQPLLSLHSCRFIATCFHCQPVRARSRFGQMLALLTYHKCLLVSCWRVACCIKIISQTQVWLHLDTAVCIHRRKVAASCTIWQPFVMCWYLYECPLPPCTEEDRELKSQN